MYLTDYSASSNTQNNNNYVFGCTDTNYPASLLARLFCSRTQGLCLQPCAVVSSVRMHRHGNQENGALKQVG